MPPKSNKPSESVFSKTWRFLHEDSPDEPIPEKSQSKSKKQKSQVRNKNSQVKSPSTPFLSNPFSAIINKYSALQQQKKQSRKKKPEKQKSSTTTQYSSRNSSIQKQPSQNSNQFKRPTYQKTPFSSRNSKAQSSRVSFMKPSKTEEPQQENYFQLIKRVISQQQKAPVPQSQSKMFSDSGKNPQSQRRPSLQSLWNRQSQVGTRSRVRLQYEKFFDNSENVFFEETTMMKEDAWIDYVWRAVLAIFFINFIIWFAIISIQPYDKPCPRHATCGAFINCHEGYILDRTLNMCEIDPKIKQSGLVIMNGFIQDMKYEYGEKECTVPAYMTGRQKQEYLKPPKKTLYEIFTALDINSQDFKVLRNVLTQYFNDKNHQKLGKFRIGYLDKIEPEQKLYSLSCKVNLMYERNFTLFIISCLMLIIFLIWLGFTISNRLHTKKAHKIYMFLKQKVNEKKDIKYEHYRLDIQEKFNRNIQISEELWVKINDFRIQEKVIGSYERIQGNNHYIYWKALNP